MFLGYQKNKIKFYTRELLSKELYNLDKIEETNDEYVLVDDEYVLNTDYKVLFKSKEQKIQENDLKRDETLNQGVLYKNILFDSDTDQKVNLLAIVSTMQNEDVITWFGKDNQPLECNKEDLINIGSLITQLHSFCWTNNAEIKDAINDAETVEDVENIVIDYTMPEIEENEEELPNLQEESEGTENV